ncbi:MAG: DUF402 domain-containing protein [Chloroflexi bacterium]|jgi:hypothetical protein|nr:DUF402 domain-containing protein [Anaerolineaceae bacterium]NMB87301.1 DUF402 domain-containing protein [Chloroflexota bacterium]
MADVVVIKRNHEGKETWRYDARILERRTDGVLIEAFFNRPDLPFHGITLGQGDRFIEAYYTQCWFNIFEIHDRGDDHLKGWYCNVTRPAEIKDGEISYVDLALDLLVYPDGKQLVLDEDEFEELHLPEDLQQQARAALQELQALFKPPVGILLDRWSHARK